MLIGSAAKRGRTSSEKPESDQIDPDVKDMWRSALRFSAVGLEMGLAVLLGYILGAWMDSRWGTKPYLTLVMVLVGVAAGFRAIIRVAREANRQREDTSPDG